MMSKNFLTAHTEQIKPIVLPLIEWYNQNRRDLPWRHNPTPYRVWISEIMLQQTRVDPVIPYYLRFMEALPDVDTLANCREDDLMKLWEGLGYYSRARNLQKAAQCISAAGRFPSDFEGWRALPGIGDYTAGAICSIALGLPTPAVDGNVLRVLSRILGSTADIAAPQTKNHFTEALRDAYIPGKTSELTQGLMELGATVCIPNGVPLCNECPLHEFCVARKEGRTNEIPVKSPKKKRRVEKHTILILRRRNRIALQRRPEKGLLANLWEFPNVSEPMDEKAVSKKFDLLDSKLIKKLPSSVHIFTHVEWHMIGYEIEVSEESPEFTWFSIDEILQQKAIPSAFRCYTDYLKDLRYEV